MTLTVITLSANPDHKTRQASHQASQAARQASQAARQAAQVSQTAQVSKTARQAAHPGHTAVQDQLTVTVAGPPCPETATNRGIDTLLTDGATLWSHSYERIYGDADFGYSAAGLAAQLHHRLIEHVVYLAYEHGRCVGCALVAMPLRADRQLARVEMHTAADRDAADVRSALWHRIVADLESRNRSRVSFFIPLAQTEIAPTAAQSAAQLATPPTAAGEWATPPTAAAKWATPPTAAYHTVEILLSPAAHWAQDRGAELSLVEYVSVLRIPTQQPPALAPSVKPQGSATGDDDGYRLINWVDEVPEPYVAHFARLREQLLRDTPDGDLIREEQSWDSARVREAEQATRALGQRAIATGAVSAAGELVAASIIIVSDYNRGHGLQADTIVAPEHRGRQLGLRIKQANIQHLAQVAPQVDRIYTWNAVSNDGIVNTNAQLGVAPVGGLAIWEMELPAG